MGSFTAIHNYDYYNRYLQHRICSFRHIASYILKQLGVGSTAVNESILEPFSKQTFHSPHGIERFTTSHQWLGLAVFSLACPDLAVDHCPNASTYKSHSYGSWPKQLGTVLQQRAYTHTTFYIFTLKHKHNWCLLLYIHIFLNFILASLTGQLGQHSSERHNYTTTTFLAHYQK